METDEQSEKERYYDEVIAPKLAEIAKDAGEQGLNFVALVEWEPGSLARTACAAMAQGLSFMMANWAAQCCGNVDSFWMAVQKYAMKHGHSSVFLKEQGIPENPEDEVDDVASGDSVG